MVIQLNWFLLVGTKACCEGGRKEKCLWNFKVTHSLEKKSKSRYIIEPFWKTMKAQKVYSVNSLGRKPKPRRRFFLPAQKLNGWGCTLGGVGEEQKRWKIIKNWFIFSQVMLWTVYRWRLDGNTWKYSRTKKVFLTPVNIVSCTENTKF